MVAPVLLHLSPTWGWSRSDNRAELVAFCFPAKLDTPQDGQRGQIVIPVHLYQPLTVCSIFGAWVGVLNCLSFFRLQSRFPHGRRPLPLGAIAPPCPDAM